MNKLLILMVLLTSITLTGMQQDQKITLPLTAANLDRFNEQFSTLQKPTSYAPTASSDMIPQDCESTASTQPDSVQGLNHPLEPEDNN